MIVQREIQYLFDKLCGIPIGVLFGTVKLFFCRQAKVCISEKKSVSLRRDY